MDMNKLRELMEAHTDLDAEVCHCGTIRKLIDEAAEDAMRYFDNDGCIVWHTAKHLLAIQMLGNMWVSAQTERGTAEADALQDMQNTGRSLGGMVAAIGARHGEFLGDKLTTMIGARNAKH